MMNRLQGRLLRDIGQSAMQGAKVGSGCWGFGLS